MLTTVSSASFENKVENRGQGTGNRGQGLEIRDPGSADRCTLMDNDGSCQSRRAFGNDGCRTR